MSSSFPPPPPPPAPPPAGHQNVAGNVQVMELSATSQALIQSHQVTVDQLAIQKLAANLTTVPTLPQDVRQELRQLGQPVRLFGENLADIRQRLRLSLATRQYYQQQQSTQQQQQQQQLGEDEDDEEQVTKYTRASPQLVQARQELAQFSLSRAQARLERERRLRQAAHAQKTLRKRKATLLLSSADKEKDKEEEALMDKEASVLTQLDDACQEQYGFLKQVGLQGSQYGDSRTLSSLCTLCLPQQTLAVTASWTSSIHLWDIPSLDKVGEATLCHEDRIMGMDVLNPIRSNNDNISSDKSILISTVSIDRTAKLWKVEATENGVQDMEVDDQDDSATKEKTKTKQSLPFTISQVHHLQGHEARLCRTAFHPMQRHVGTTSMDHSWRLWDVETGQGLLLQDGHAGGVFGLDFHPDGSLCATTDVASVIQLWDLRTGKSIHHFTGQHAKRILCAAFAPNGFQLATAGDDGTIKIFDLRRRKLSVSIPAHSNLVSKLEFCPGNYNFNGGDEFLVSSSFDGTAKIWSTRAEWKWINTLTGHEGKVSSVGILPNRGGGSNSSSKGGGILTCGFDKTLKHWA